jgi:chromosome partitioning protein
VRDRTGLFAVRTGFPLVVEKAVRKLLVASQKGGVGKTTTSMNLAAAAARSGSRVLLLDADPLSNVSISLNLIAHPQRQSLRQAGLDLPGALVADVVPGVDVISPYDEGRCSDEDFDSLLRVMSTPVFREGYSCLLVDAPPFLGANPGQLIRACDEFILVMRAEPTAYRTLPAFLELVQRNRAAKGGIQMRGILLTLNEGEQPGERWERDLRSRFGTRILPHTIPYDPEVAEATLFGRIISHASPDSVVAREYVAAAATLRLTEPPATAGASLVPLLQAAVDALERRRVAAGSGVRRSVEANGTALLDHGDDPVPDLPEVDLPEDELDEEAQETTPRPGRTVRPVPVVRKPEEVEEQEPEEHEEPEEKPEEQEQQEQPVQAAVSPSKVRRAAAAERRRAEPPTASPNPPAPTPSGTPAWLVPVFVAMAVGFGMGFIQQPSFMLPVLVGVVVAAGVLLILRLSSDNQRGRAPKTRVHPSIKNPRRPANTARLSKTVRRPRQNRES